MKLVLWLIVLAVALMTGGLYYLVNANAAIYLLLAASLIGNVIGYCYMGKYAPLFIRDRHTNRFTIEWPNTWFSNRR